MDAETTAEYQQAFAKIGEAINQCPGCEVFTLDGSPPVLHRVDCPDQGCLMEIFQADQLRLRRLYGLDLTP